MLAIVFTNLIVGIFLIWSGYMIYNKKKYFLIAGYNDMNPQQKKRVDIKRLSKSMKTTLYYIGLSIAIFPSTLNILGYDNWGISYPVIIIPGAIYYLTISIISIRWKSNNK